MKILYLLFFLNLLLLILTAHVYGQVPAPMLPSEPSQAPIDGGLALLAAAGGGYAIKKLRDRKK